MVLVEGFRMDSVDTSEEEQQLVLVLPRHQFSELISGTFEGEGPTIHDVADERVLDNGKAPSQYTLFWRVYTSWRSFVLIERLRPDGTVNRVYLWIGPEGVIVAGDNQTESTITMVAAELDSRFTFLIDGMVLGRRNVPREYEPGYGVIQQKDIMNVISPDLSEAERRASAKRLAESVSHVQPEMAQDLVDGQFEAISIVVEWPAGFRNEMGSLLYLDTPHGYLRYNTERHMMRKKHQLEPASGWYVLAQAVSMLPPEELIASWQEEGLGSKTNDRR